MNKWMSLVFALAAILVVGACEKKAAPTQPPPPLPPAPTASVSVNPDKLEKGHSTTLTWQTTNATDVTIDGIGMVDAVAPNGSRQVTPEDSMTYHLTAKGAGGTQEADARVTITSAQAPPPTPSPTEEELSAQSAKDTFFDHDTYDIRTDADISMCSSARGKRASYSIHRQTGENECHAGLD